MNVSDIEKAAVMVLDPLVVKVWLPDSVPTHDTVSVV